MMELGAEKASNNPRKYIFLEEKPKISSKITKQVEIFFTSKASTVAIFSFDFHRIML